MTPALTLVVFTHIEQHHRLVERRGHIGDPRLRYRHLVHAVHADTTPVTRTTAVTAGWSTHAVSAMPGYPQFPQVHPQPAIGRNPV